MDEVLKQPEHIEIAQKIAFDMINNNSEKQVNEMILVIVETVNNNRNSQIQELKAKIEYLQSTLPIFK